MSDLEESDVPERPDRPWCLFQGVRRAYAIGLESVVEVVEVDRLVRFPHSPPRVLGLCTLRREVLPVIDLDPSERTVAPEARGKRLVLILRTSQGRWAVQMAGEGTTVAEEPLDGARPSPDPVAPWLTFLGTVRRGETVYAVIDPEATWKHVREGVETYYTGHWLDATPGGKPWDVTWGGRPGPRPLASVAVNSPPAPDTRQPRPEGSDLHSDGERFSLAARQPATGLAENAAERNST